MSLERPPGSRSFWLDVYDWLHIFGIRWVTGEEWVARFAPHLARDGTARWENSSRQRRWERMKQRLRKNEVPHECLDAQPGETDRRTRIRLRPEAQALVRLALDGSVRADADWSNAALQPDPPSNTHARCYFCRRPIKREPHWTVPRQISLAGHYHRAHLDCLRDPEPDPDTPPP